MTRSVVFNGITQFRPGGLTRVNANALAQIGLLTNGIVGLIGEADGGTPNEIITIDDPALAKSTFRSGPLADAIRIAFDPSSDPRVPGGAFRCLCVKTNQGTKATLTLYQLVFDTDIVAVGSTTTVVQLTTGGLAVNVLAGVQISVNGETRTVVSNTATAVTVSSAFTTAPLTGIVVIFITGKRAAAAASTTTVVNVSPTGLTASEHIGNLLRVNGEERPITANSTSSITVSPAFSSAPVTNTPIYILSPQLTLSSRDYGSHTNQVKVEFEPGATSGSAWTTTFENKSQTSLDLGARSYLDVEYVGQSLLTVQASGTTTGAGSSTQIVDAGAAFGTLTNYFVRVSGGALAEANFRKISTNAATTIDVAIAFRSGGVGTAPGAGAAYSVRTGAIQTGGIISANTTANTVTLESNIDFGLNELAGMVITMTNGPSAGARRVIASNTSGISTVLTLDESWESGKLPLSGNTYDLRYVTKAVGLITGTGGSATRFRALVRANGATVDTTDLDITFSVNQTLKSFVEQVNANNNYKAYVPNGVNGQTTLMKSFDYDARNSYVDLRNDRVANNTNKNSFRRDLQLIIDDFNVSSELLTAVRSAVTSTGAGGAIAEYTSGSVGVPGDVFKFLAGGTRGSSTNTNWQAAFDLLLQKRVNHIAPLISEDLVNEGLGSTATFTSIAAQLSNHVDIANGAGKSERGGYIGMKGTKSQIIAQANSLNIADVQLSAQKLRVLDVNGNLTLLSEWSSAVVAAGMRAGMPEVGEPLTWKFIKTSEVTQDPSWDPKADTDANQFIQNGILFALLEEGRGIRWERDLTTHIQDDNLAFSEGSVRDVVRFVSFGLRTTLELRFTGVKSSPASVTAIKDTAANFLEVQRSNNIIVDSTNESGQILHAWKSLRVVISGDIARIRVEIFPSVGINYILIDEFLQLPTQAA